MAYDYLKSQAEQVSNQFTSTLPSFMPQAAPLQTDTITKILPFGVGSWKGGWQPRTPAEIESNKQSMMNAYNDMRQDGFSSNDIANRLSSGFTYTNLEKGIGSQAFQNSISPKLQGPEPTGPTAQQQRQLDRATRKAAHQERREERQAERDGSNPEQDVTNALPTGTGNAMIDAFSAFNGIKDSTRYEKGDGFKSWTGSTQGLATSGAINAAAGAVNMLADAGIGAEAKRPEAQQLNETQEAVRQGIYSGVSMIPGFGPLISGGLQLIDGIGKLTGTQMSNISKDAAEDAGLSRGWNNVMATIPGVGSVMGLFAKKTDEFEVDRERLAGVGSAYDISTFDSAEDLSGGKFLGQGKKVNDFIAEQNRLRDTMTGISDTQKLRKEGMGAAAADLAQQNKNRYAGVTGGSMAIGKKGMKLQLDYSRALLKRFQTGGKTEKTKPKRRTLEELKAYADSVNPRFIQRANDPNIIGINFIDDEGKASFGTHYMEVGDDGEGNYYVYPRIQEINGQLQFFKDWREALNTALKNKNYLLFDNLEEADNFATNYKKVYPVFQKFQKGGKLGLDTNIIVEGSYHAHKNHLDEINPELGDMTPKGIPVAAQTEDGSKVQVAEIERKELILTKELTDKIEALYKDGSDEAAIEAGILFTNELFNNTQDNTGEVLNE